ncbi:MAG: exosome complex RNA-binding protein Rrp4 [Candidatus Hydrothermarchaeota archaeon]|nr:exosome complex RNA-binding protein Rrp4 [Candidatus Hydrothermarchaeota archaeon]
MPEKLSRKMVLPGELVAKGPIKLGDGVYREGEQIYAAIMGLLDHKKDFIRVIPLTGKYIPHVGDYVIGVVMDVMFSGWEIDINSAYNGILNGRDYISDIDIFQTSLVKILSPGSMIFACVREITPTKKVYITMTDNGARVLRGGRFLTINPTRIPRLIGKKSSMISMIKREAQCTVLVGQNGRVWLNGKPEIMAIAARAVERIEKEAQIPGLTDNIKKMIIEEREKL